MTKLCGKGHIIEVVKGKKYRIQFSLGFHPVTGKRLRHTETFFGTKRNAELRVEELRRQYASGKNVEADKLLFSELLEKFLTSREGMEKVRPATLKQNRITARHLTNYLPDVKAVDVTPIAITDMYAKMRKDGLGDTTIVHCHKLMKQVMKFGVVSDVILRNPMDKVEAPKKPKPKRQALATDESKRLASIVTSGEPTANKTAVYLGLAIGARIGEVLGITWERVVTDEERPYIYLLYQLSREGELVPLKTDDDDNPVGRVIPIDASTVEVLEKWREEQRKQLAEFDIEQTGETHVITNGLGAPCDHSNFSRWWRSFCVKNGFGKWVDEEGRDIITLKIGEDASEHPDCVIEWRDAEGWPCDEAGKRYSRSYKRPKLKRVYDGLKFHELRHTHFTQRLADGKDIPTAQALGGWSTPTMLMTTYAHPVPENVWASAGFMDALTNEKEGESVNRLAHVCHKSEGGEKKKASR